MKVILHIPTEQYGFVAVEVDDASAYMAADLYREYAEAFKPRVGFAEKDFNRLVDEYLNTGTLKEGTEHYEQMNDKQKYFFQTLKRHYKRNGYAESLADKQSHHE